MRVATFYPNENDDLHCLQASVRMVFETMTGSELTLQQAEDFTGFVSGQQTWPFQTMISFADHGFDVINVEKMDNEWFARSPKEACIAEYGEDIWKHFLKVSDVEAAQKAAAMCVQNKNITMEKKIPELSDIRSLLDRGFLAICNVNYKALAGEEGYNGHFVVVEDVDVERDIVRLQNPGLPPIRDQEVEFERFLKAWYYPNSGAGNVMGVRKK